MNCKDKLKAVKISLNLWLQRNLSLKGKIAVLKSLIIPKLQFVGSNSYMSDDFVKVVQDLTFQFLWGHKPAKIKKETIIADIANGGLKMPLFSTVLETARIMWIKRILTAKSSKWARLSLSLMNTNEFGLFCKNEPNDACRAATPFYRQVLSAWYKFHSVEPKQAEEIQQEILWNNRFILNNRKPMFNPKWIDNGVLCIQDLLGEGGKFLTLAEVNKRYNVKAHFLEYLGIVKAIPKPWLESVRRNINVTARLKHVDNVISVNYDRTTALTSKQVYWCLINDIVKQPTAIQHWIEEFPFLHDNDFDEFFTLAHKNGEVKLQSFQYKILHRIFPCRYMLNKWKIKDSNKCECREIDTIEHYFFYCRESKRLWNCITEWFDNIYQVKIPLKIVNVMMGIPHRQSQDQVLNILNFTILHGKWFIYCCKRNYTKVVPRSFKTYMKRVFHIQICLMLRKGITSTQWQAITQSLR